jgi:translation elongation factor EF-4
VSFQIIGRRGSPGALSCDASRALSACEGALLVVDASQGVMRRFAPEN